ncbi:unnamed protein product, partial [Ectocarpus fasciculatus]
VIDDQHQTHGFFHTTHNNRQIATYPTEAVCAPVARGHYGSHTHTPNSSIPYLLLRFVGNHPRNTLQTKSCLPCTAVDAQRAHQWCCSWPALCSSSSSSSTLVCILTLSCSPVAAMRCTPSPSQREDQCKKSTRTRQQAKRTRESHVPPLYTPPRSTDELPL